MLEMFCLLKREITFQDNGTSAYQFLALLRRYAEALLQSAPDFIHIKPMIGFAFR